MAKFSHETVLYALGQAGFSDEEIKGLNVLEVGCGMSPPYLMVHLPRFPIVRGDEGGWLIN